MSTSRSQLLHDDSGYSPTTEVLEFLGLTDDDVEALLARSSPLGVTRDEYEAFKDSLDAALKTDGVHDADIRLQGSSAHFFSGKHKTMPLGVAEVLETFLDSRGRTPSRPELDRIMARLAQLWPASAAPLRRPFDSLHRLRIERYPSDIDVQISSDTIADRAKAFVAGLGIPEERIVVENPKYAFVRKEYVAQVAPSLTSWALRQSDTLPRPVTVAVFPSAGPPPINGPVSSHFKSDDWMVYVGGGGGA